MKVNLGFGSLVLSLAGLVGTSSPVVCAAEIPMVSSQHVDSSADEYSTVVTAMAATATLASLAFKDAYTVKLVNSDGTAPSPVGTDVLSFTAKIPVPTTTTFSDTDSIDISFGDYSYSAVLSDAVKKVSGKSTTYTFNQADISFDKNGNPKDISAGKVTVTIAKGSVTVAASLKTSELNNLGLLDIVSYGFFGGGSLSIADVTTATFTVGSVTAEFLNVTFKGKDTEKENASTGDLTGSCSLSGGDKAGVVTTIVP